MLSCCVICVVVVDGVSFWSILVFSKLDYYFCAQATTFDLSLVYSAPSCNLTFTSRICCLRITILLFCAAIKSMARLDIACCCVA